MGWLRTTCWACGSQIQVECEDPYIPDPLDVYICEDCDKDFDAVDRGERKPGD